VTGEPAVYMTAYVGYDRAVRLYKGTMVIDLSKRQPLR
jgi:hypothetical protein